jgi:hypothetical protein
MHLEVVPDCSMEVFFVILWRFLAKRGVCRTIYNDCGTDFQGENREHWHFTAANDGWWQETADTSTRLMLPTLAEFGKLLLNR